MAKKKRYNIHHCLYCLNKGKTRTQARIKSGDKQMIALDRPYINLTFHRKCYNKIPDMEKFLKDTYKLWRKPWFKQSI